MSIQSPKIDDYVAAYLETVGDVTARHLYEVIKLRFPSFTEEAFTDLLQELSNSGKINAFSEPIRDWKSYLLTWEESLWFYASIAACILAASSAYLIPQNSMFLPARWALGLLLVLFLPGYVTLEALYPATKLGAFVRFALSVGVSMILDMLSGLVLSYSQWGIHLTPIVISLATVTFTMALIALLRHCNTSATPTQLISATK